MEGEVLDGLLIVNFLGNVGGNDRGVEWVD